MRKLTKKEIIDIFIKVHGDKYDYSKVNYINTNTKVDIICKEHGVFKQIPKDHKRGFGCKRCYGIGKNTNDVILEFKKIHGDRYDYSEVVYKNSKYKVDIICPNHGLFKQMPNHHLSGHGCPKCGRTKNLTSIEILKEFKDKHKNKYDYSKVNYISDNHKVIIICLKHGEFTQNPGKHKMGQGCPKCKSSKGEQRIIEFLSENEIKYEHQKKFKNCILVSNLIFDFYLPDYNLCIEYDGIQHFEPISAFGGVNEFEKLIKRDSKKNEYCKNNNIDILRISYKNFDDLEKIIQSKLNNK